MVRINDTIIILDKYYLSFTNTLNFILYRLFFETQGRKHGRNLKLVMPLQCCYYTWKVKRVIEIIQMVRAHKL